MVRVAKRARPIRQGFDPAADPPLSTKGAYSLATVLATYSDIVSGFNASLECFSSFSVNNPGCHTIRYRSHVQASGILDVLSRLVSFFTCLIEENMCSCKIPRVVDGPRSVSLRRTESDSTPSSKLDTDGLHMS